MADFIGYKGSKVGTTLVPIVTSDPMTSIVASAVATIAASWSGWFDHPAADARNIISQAKPVLAQQNARSRMGTVIAAASKIDRRAKDVEARELMLWYRQNYPNDYKDLTADDMAYWNNLMQNNARMYVGVNQAAQDYIASQFTTGEIASKNPVTALTSLTSGGTTNYLLYGAIAIALFLIFRKK